MGLLGYESVINRDYPVVLGSLYIFGLIGLLDDAGSDLTFMWLWTRALIFEGEGGIDEPVSSTQRRLHQFRANKRGLIVWLFGAACFLYRHVPMIANDKPIFVKFDGGFYMRPFLTAYAETEFGGDFETEAEYRDPFVIDD